MERINLSVLSGVSHEGMLQLKSYVDMTGLDPQHQSYDYECLFPETCNPREVCLSFVKTADGYTFRVNPHFRYDGSNAIMVLLADQGTVSFSSWQEAEQALRTLTENVAGTTTSNATPDTLTNWDEISVPEQSESQTPSFEHLKERLQKMVIGQDDSTEAIAYVVAQHLAKKNPTKPVSILASGSPGVGKSETAKALAKILSQDCGQEYAVSWIDLNNFTEAFSVYRLIGAPAGYIGYEDEAVFEVVERNPYTIFIFDELDKAHPEVLKTFMAILDEGRCASRKALSDGSREFDFKHCIFFFTSNYDLSSSQPAKRRIGFTVSDDVEDIHLEENEVSVSYRDEQASSISDESLPMRIYRENEAARKAFVGVGVLREIASRFQCFVNFKPLSAKAKTRILAKQIIEMGFEYSHAISYVSPGIMQGLIDAAMSGDSKKRVINNGERRKYLVEQSHESIISKTVFEQVQEEIVRRQSQIKMATHTSKGQFSGLLTCANCGKHFRRRIANASSKYAKPAWLCSTFATKGKRYCNNKQIPEAILIDKTKDVLGLHSLDGVDLRSYISEIICYQNQELTFILTNGDKITVTWSNPSRRNSWTEEMKRAARQKTLERSSL